MKTVLLFFLLVIASFTTVASIPKGAVDAYNAHKGQLANSKYITVVDYSLSIFSDRLTVYNAKTHAVVLQAWVSHASRSGMFYAESFSNASGSNKSSLGSYVTENAYQGKYGYSMRLKGISATNSNAHSRAVVFHPANKMYYSNGCFMTNTNTNRRLIELIKGGGLVYVFQ